jgi:23S rRNA pseudouridine1911/1915/1917 synthase
MATPFGLDASHIVYLDNHLLVVNKPAGILVQPDREGNPSVEEAAREWLREKFQKPGNVFATAAHRLDRPVSGLVVLARTSKSLARMNALFQSRAIRKVYLCLTGGLPEDFIFLRHWIKKNEETNKVRTYTYARGDARQADLAYWCVEKQGPHSLLMVRLFTGRHHQIRAQLSASGLPIVGDSKYGIRGLPQDAVCLYSYGLSFTHPVSGQELLLKGNLPVTGSWEGFSEPGSDALERAFQLVPPPS